ncbi:hypothetical protein GCM10009789_40460 [Kribbella sancticallisti]|uniref:Uncharacterized protein n=1 Tax=Kribbella sancticallisti TaxID=460087 RepID=A0ABP4PIV7_9ACTN
MKLRHTRVATAGGLRHPNLMSSAGLVPVLALADQTGLHELTQMHLTVPSDKGANTE